MHPIQRRSPFSKPRSTHILRRHVLRAAAGALAYVVCSGYSCQEPEALTGAGVWKFWGGNLHNTHSAEAEKALGPDTVGRLRVAWSYETAGSVTAIPTVSEDAVYVTDWGTRLGGSALIRAGRLHAIDRRTGAKLWSHSLSEYGADALHDVSRSSPAIDETRLFIGDALNQEATVLGVGFGHGTALYAIDRASGKLLWRTVVETHPLAQITTSPVVYNGRVYVGVSSQEEAAAKRGNYACCTFRGSVVAVDAGSGRILWKTYTVPDNFGMTGHFAGAAVWGSAPAVDAARKVVYVSTGNDYTLPRALADCANQNPTDAAARQRCFDQFDLPDNYAEAILALDLETGAVRWARKLGGYDAWNFACDPGLVPWLPTATAANCPFPAGGDFDFGQAPMLTTVEIAGRARDVVEVGQKTGVFWALDPDKAGATIWMTRVGPGGTEGGMEFGSATDGKRIYVQITNGQHTDYTLVAGRHAGEQVDGGIWAALDPATGQILWQTPDPSSFLPHKGWIVHPVYGAGLGAGFFGIAKGPLSVANGVVYGGSMDEDGHMYAFDAATGEILWSFASGGSVMSAPAIVDGMVYWGSGAATGFDAHRFFAFSL